MGHAVAWWVLMVALSLWHGEQFLPAINTTPCHHHNRAAINRGCKASAGCECKPTLRSRSPQAPSRPAPPFLVRPPPPPSSSFLHNCRLVYKNKSNLNRLSAVGDFCFRGRVKASEREKERNPCPDPCVATCKKGTHNPREKRYFHSTHSSKKVKKSIDESPRTATSSFFLASSSHITHRSAPTHPTQTMSQVFEPLYYSAGAVAGVVEGLSR